VNPETTMIAAEDHHAQHVNHEHLNQHKMDENDEEDDEDDGLDMENEDVAHAVLVAAADMAENASAEALAAAVADVTGRVGGEMGGVEAGGGPPLKRRRTGKRGARPWNDMLFELLKYRFLHGNVMVPFKSGGDLGKWVAVQRAQYMSLQKSIQAKQENNEEESKKWASAASEGGTERLTEERMKVLSSIGFVWDVVSVECSVSMVLLPLQTGQIT
jgi:Helicase associated domain